MTKAIRVLLAVALGSLYGLATPGAADGRQAGGSPTGEDSRARDKAIYTLSAVLGNSTIGHPERLVDAQLLDWGLKIQDANPGLSPEDTLAIARNARDKFRQLSGQKSLTSADVRDTVLDLVREAAGEIGGPASMLYKAVTLNMQASEDGARPCPTLICSWLPISMRTP